MKKMFFALSLVSTIGLAQTQIPTRPAQISMPKLLFKTNFKEVTLGPLFGFTARGAYQSMIGEGFPPKSLNANLMGAQLISHIDIDPSTISSIVKASIESVDGPNRSNAMAFKGLVLKKFIGAKTEYPVTPQVPFLIRRDFKTDLSELYIKYHARHRADLAEKLKETVSSGNWYQQFAFKTGGHKGTGGGDFRFSVVILENKEKKLYWMCKADSNANANTAEVPLKDFWVIRNETVPVPVGKWFKVEVYWKRSNEGEGRYWAAIDGKPICDYKGPKTKGDFNLNVGRIFIMNAYSGGDAPVQSEVTNLEIWDKKLFQ